MSAGRGRATARGNGRDAHDGAATWKPTKLQVFSARGRGGSHGPLAESMSSKLRRFLFLPTGDKWLLLEATFWLALAGALVHFVPIRFWQPWLGRQREGAPATQTGGVPPSRVQRCSQWLTVAARHLPWHPVCLPQAVALHAMLRLRGYPSIVVLGVRQKPDARGIDAHAWLVQGERVAIGGDIDGYAPLCHFA